MRDNGGKKMKYIQALVIMHIAVMRGYDRQRLEKIWKRVKREAAARGDRIDYVYCPICETYLDWAWCTVCHTNR